MIALAMNFAVAQENTQAKDSLPNEKDSLRLRYNFNHSQTGNLLLTYPSKYEVIYDKDLNKYIIVEKVGDYYIKTPIFMTPGEYKKYRLQRDMLEYFKSKISARNSKNVAAKKDLLPTYYVNSKFFETLFGGNEIKITPTGNINLKLGFIYQKTDDPRLSEQNRSSFTFDFDQQISAGIQAQIGKRMNFTANYDTQSTFDFQNLIKLEYSPTEDDIIQAIEAGNVTMPIKNSLINGSQSLFGIKTKLQFGKTSVTAVFSQQNSEATSVTAEAGSSIQEFELRATDYDNDRHFFLSQYFRENYARSLSQYPLVSSPVNITRVEVWITNRNASVDDFRSIVAFADIGEPNKDNYVDVDNGANTVQPNTGIPSAGGVELPTNQANNIADLLTPTGGIRDIGTVDETLQTTFAMEQGTDYSLLQNARKLQPNEYTLNPQLGFISLNRRLNDGEILAVAYEYTVVGSSTGDNSFKVGEFSNDGINAPNNLAVKLLRSEILTTNRPDGSGGIEPFPTWNLMMKNIYPLGAFPLEPNGFRFEIQYRDDQTGIPSNTLQNAQSTAIANTPLLQVMNLDRLDQTQFQTPDGFFDYVEGITVDSQNGFVIFPSPEPFGTGLEAKLDIQADIDLFVFNELYLDTKINVKNNNQDKDKFFLKGYFKGQNSGGIPLGAFNVPRGSVTVTAGGRQLVEGVDFVVDYQLGRVQILDPGLQSSGIPIQVSTENNAVFNQQRKTFMGVDIEHKFNEDFIVGGTVLNVNERPLTPKVNFGTEPINNTMLGLNMDFSSEVPILTKLINKLPFVDTDAPSNLAVRADMAYLIPGSPSGIDVTGGATAYVDDFEASQIPISLLTPLQWFTASTPRGSEANLNGEANDVSYNDFRARLAWYNIDPIFYGAGDTPSNINADEVSRDETRQVNISELFPNQELDVTQQTLVRTLDLAYFPSERGPYNFTIESSTEILPNPETRWGGIMRPLTTNNFEQANVEYIQFWLMDPYLNYSISNEEGLPVGINPQDISNQVGDLYFNLGNISEDILKDNRKMYENGLPTFGGTDSTIESIWGKVPENPSIIYAFDESDEARTNQDIGLDGLSDAEERVKFPALGGLSDPASDNYQYYRGSELDAIDASIITRYKLFNNTQGNSPTLNQSPESYPTSATTYPDVEDINRDQTMNTVESYYEYKVSLNKSDLTVGQNFIVDQKETDVTLDNGQVQTTRWYQFRIPIRGGTPVNGISDFNSIRFIRMFITNAKIPMILRFGELDLVRGDWRRYTKTLDPAVIPDEDLTQTELNNFEVGVVNIEQNEGRYVLPPGIVRERLQGSTTVQQQNEQSVSLTVNNLPQNKIRAIYKNISIDLRRYKQLKMFIHTEPVFAESVTDDDLSAIIRLGTDLNDNFYQLELPLKVSPEGSLDPLDVWPELNNLDAFLEALGKVKLQRDASGAAINELFTASGGDNSNALVIRVKGNPTLAQIRTVMLGVRNNSSLDRSAEVWFNELRASGFDNDGGWAAVVSADANFADVANVSMTGRMQTIGFGSVEDRVSQRSLDETKQYDISTSFNVGKIMPKKWGIEVPMNFSIGEQFIDPKFDPQYQDVELAEVEAANLPGNLERGTSISRDYTKRKSISFINVRKNRNPESTKSPKFYDPENLSMSYAYNEESHRDYNIERAINKTVTASASYNFNFNSKPFEPFKKTKFLKKKYLKLIRDVNFNPIPKNIAINSRINRSYNQQRSRNLVEGLSAQPTLIQRRFLFDWDYTLGFELTKSLNVNFNATNSYIYDAFDGDEELEIFDNFFNMGRPSHYQQKLNATYKIPINKLPFLGFVSADYAYTADFDWRAISQDQTIVEQVGNLIQNANTHNISGAFNLSKFYKDIRLENIFVKKKKKTGSRKSSELPGIKTPTQNARNKWSKLSFGQKVLKGFYDILTSVKNAKIAYAENNGQLLPGYQPEVGFLGRDQIGGSLAPSLGFVFGSQIDIRNRALTNGWLVDPRLEGDDYYDKTFSKTHYNKLDYNFSLKPLKDLTIEITGNKIRTRNLSQQIDIRRPEDLGISISDPNDPRNLYGVIDEGIPSFINGNFSTSYSMFSTAFKDGDQLFQALRDNRIAISQRLGARAGIDTTDPNNLNDDGTVKGFGDLSQDVLLPAFLSAYSGKDPNSVKLDPFRDIPIPNWTLRYTGLMKYKWFKDNFSSFSIAHGYRSSYTISNFTNNLQYDSTNPFGPENINPSSEDMDFNPGILISSATLVDEFNPLIRIDLKMKNSFSFRGELKKDRTLTLNLNNGTLTDIMGTEYVFGLGYVFKDVKMRTSFTGKTQTLKGDINLRADISLRDNITLVRSIDTDNDQISGGQKLFSIKFSADYRLNSNLTTSFFYNHQTSRYAISTTLPRQSINAGFNFIYNLGEN